MYGTVAATGAGYLAPYVKRYAQQKALKYGKYVGARAVSYAKNKAANAFNSYRAQGKKSITKPKIRSNNTSGGADAGYTIGHSTKISKSKKKSKKLEQSLKETPPVIYRDGNQSAQVCPDGQQYVSSIGSWWTYGNLTSANEGIPVAANMEARFWVEGGHIRTTFCNFTAIPVTLQIYDVVAKIDVPSGNDPQVLAANGLKAKYGNVTNPLSLPHVQLNESVAFKNAFKIEASKIVILSPGENHVHDNYFKIQKFFDNDKYQGLTAPSYVKGFTHLTMIRQLGALVTDDNSVSYGQNKIGWVNHFTADYKYPQGKAAGQLLAYNVNLPPTIVAANEKFNNESSGTALGNTQA